MKTYTRKDATVQAAQVTAINYTLDDGSTRQDTPDAASIGGYWVVNHDGTEGFMTKDAFIKIYGEEPTAPLAA